MAKREKFFDNAIWVPHGRVHNWFVYVAAYIVRPVLKLCFRYKVKGLQNLRELGDEPVVFVMNHVSYADPCIGWCALYSHAHGSRILARSSLYRPIIGGLLARVGALPVDPDSPDRSAIKRAVACLKRGENMLIYPEGTRMNRPDKPYHPHAGAVLIANMGKARIVPVGILGPEKIMPYDKAKFIRFPRIYVNFGTPIDPRDEHFESIPKKGRSDAIITEIMEEVFRLRDSAADCT
jgi:1-acyl-sn-glycerol-3-phosphate acyltransferase